MSKLAIKAENISKQYRLGEVGTGTLSHDLNRIWYKMRGKEDPYLKIGESNDRRKKGESDYVWSLKDINFEIGQGDAVGIIGRNGAGKSTLLKILSKVTKPTTGNIKVNGRIASLLEVGTGFNPEMTGRENIYLNGAILGMRKNEITRKLDEIIDFSGVERYIDTPVKRYSSGMYVRLAFAVAAHLESEILIVDEVLAVGDAEFQKKCLGKMGDVSKGEGRTVLFVSHNMGAIKSLCNNGILLENGALNLLGNCNDVIDKYLSYGNDVERVAKWSETDYPTTDEVELHSILLTDKFGRVDNLLTTTDDLKVEISYKIKKPIRDLRVALSLVTNEGIEVFSTSDFSFQDPSRLRPEGEYSSICHIPGKLLNTGNYTIHVDFDVPKTRAILTGFTISFAIAELIYNQLGFTNASKPGGIIHPFIEWEISSVNKAGGK